MLTPPSINVTVPDGVPEPGVPALTVAVNVTGCPSIDGFAELVTVVRVDDNVARLTVWLRAAEVLAVKLASPLKTAVTRSVPAGSELVVREATAAVKRTRP